VRRAHLSLSAFLAIAGILCVYFGMSFVRGGSRIWFVVSLLWLAALSSVVVASAYYRLKWPILVGAACGLSGPLVAAAIIAGVEVGVIHPGGSVVTGMARLMNLLWWPGCLVSTLLGIRVRLNDLDITPIDELMEWLRLISLNVIVFALVAVGVQKLSWYLQRRSGRSKP